MPLFSDSTTIGSGKLGFVGRIFKLEDFEDNLDDPYGVATL
jgi:hypothetical protein